MSSLLTKAIAGIGCAVIALPALAALVIAAPLSNMSFASNTSATPSKHAHTDIPPRLLALYQRATLDCPGLPWTTLAAIGKVETDHARHPTMVSAAGPWGRCSSCLPT
ncbi:hypothetical protein [Streptomyces sp. C184]|uniref:hypothetical protein n=1 Tax=Streptomyces sp. C184 TaxID=3237121 RepID=UPI0034C63827